MSSEPEVKVLAETENYSIWKADEPDGETTFHIELGLVTVNLFTEEWEELLQLIKSLG